MLNLSGQILLPLSAGAGMGFLYFAGLWQTVQRLAVSPRPARLLAASYVGRLSLAGGVFYLALAQGWAPLCAALSGFLLARTVLLKMLGKISLLPGKGDGLWK